jgi:predicted permease
VSAYVQIAFRGNTALIGLPIIAYSAIVLKDETLLKNAVLSLAPAIPVWNMVSIILLNKDSVKTSTLDTRKAFIKQIVLNPLVISCVLGLLFSVANIALPQFIEFSLTRLGQMTLPLALIAIGAGLQFRKNNNVKVAITSSIIKVFIAPLLALLLCWVLGLSKTQIFTALIFCASPAAISIYVMTQELRGNYKLAGDGIVYSTVLSVIPLSAIIYFFC